MTHYKMDTSFKLFVVAAALLIKFCVNCQAQLCNERLIQNLPDDHFTASSSKSESTLLSHPYQARLNKTEQTLNNGTTLIGAWSPANDRAGEYVQAIFDEMTMISSIQTQGRHLSNDHVNLFKVEYTEDGKTWQTVNNDVGVEQIFMGNQDGDTIQDNALTCPIFARGIRIIPLEWDTHIALRFDVKGCYVDNSIIVITTPVAATLLTTTTSTAGILTSASSIPSMLTTPISTNATTTTPFMPGILTPFGTSTVGTTLLTTPTKPLSTTNSATTVNLLTLIHWFMTHINNNTTPTTPHVTTPTTAVTSPTAAMTTPTTSTASPKTAITTISTSQGIFLPGILNPFGTTKSSGGLPPIIG